VPLRVAADAVDGDITLSERTRTRELIVNKGNLQIARLPFAYLQKNEKEPGVLPLKLTAIKAAFAAAFADATPEDLANAILRSTRTDNACLSLGL